MTNIEMVEKSKDAMDLIAKKMAKHDVIELDETDSLCEQINKDFEFVTVPKSICLRNWKKLFFKGYKRGDALVFAKVNQFYGKKKKSIHVWIGDLLVIINIKTKMVPDIEATKKKYGDEAFHEMMMACPDQIPELQSRKEIEQAVMFDIISEFGSDATQYQNISDLLPPKQYNVLTQHKKLSKIKDSMLVYNEQPLYAIHLESETPTPYVFSEYSFVYDHLINTIAHYTKFFRLKFENSPTIKEDIISSIRNALAPKDG